MTWEELEHADPVELFQMSADFRMQFPPVMLDASVTIGMAAHGNIQTTLFALRALFASVCGGYELILVDDTSPDETGKLFELAREIHPNTKVFRFSNNVEYSGSLNTILSHASGDVILFVSNDIFITPSYVSQILAVSRSEPQTGIVRGCSNFVDNGLPLHTVRDCGDLDNFPLLFQYSRQRAELYGVKCHDDPFLTGDAFLVTRSVLKSVGYIDPRFYGYFADHDLGVRARRAGFRSRLAMGAFAWHQHGANMDYLNPQEREKKVRARWARVNENWARFKEKYGLAPSLPYEGMRCIPWDRIIQQGYREAGDYPPCDHTRFIVPDKEGDVVGWLRHRADELSRMARIYVNASRLDDAKSFCHQALEIKPDHCTALTVLGSAYVYGGQVSEGMRHFRLAMKSDPSCAKAHSNLLLSMHYSHKSSQRAIYRESRRWESLHVPLPRADALVGRNCGRSRIRIAYLSSDFRRHSVSYFFSPLLKYHDRSKFEIYCFSDVLIPDDISGRLKKMCDGWYDISRLDMCDADAVIRATEPDIIVDLAGHTGHTIRLPLFVQRLAPVQITWLGYPNTTGLAAMDYRLTDEIADPADAVQEAFYSENLCRLPGVFLCYEPPENSPDVEPLPALQNGHITFGSFSMLPKISTTTVAVWCEILARVPRSRLVLKNHYFRDGSAARRMMKRFAAHGIEVERISLLPSDVDSAMHLARYAMIDIALDTFPYNGTTTTCEALWMGVPVVTFAGDRHVARVGASIVNHVRLPELAAESVEHYCDVAVTLAADPDRLVVMRGEMRELMANSPLCDAAQFTCNIESAYCQMLSAS